MMDFCVRSLNGGQIFVLSGIRIVTANLDANFCLIALNENVTTLMNAMAMMKRGNDSLVE